MKMFFVSLMFVFILGCNSSTQNYLSEEKKVGGLTDSVEILRDEWGINHIYANNQKDLFFAQGYAAAQDRLFQFEIWRRQSTGTVAEILGPDELARDIGTRLFQFRGDITTELNHYHPEGKEIIESYVQGVNSYIKEILKTPEQLPLPFKMLGISPQLWTPKVVISRHQGLLGNIGQEYTNTRHNIGFEILDSFADKANISFSNARFGSISEYKFKGRSFIFLKPNTYMNLSGSAVTHWLKSEKIPLTNLLIISDDLNLPFAKLRLKPSGSNGGHNGLRDIESSLNTTEYNRLRVGISNEFKKGQQSNFVLSKFSDEELLKLTELKETVNELIISFVMSGISITMNTYNLKN